MIFAIAAVSLNLILGYGGMVSFGHAAYLGIGAYAVGILAFDGINSGFIQWPVALAASALFALVIGALSLRTSGVYFIMITLAFAQMLYYVGVGLDALGGDDGMRIYKRSHFCGLVDLSNRCVLLLCLSSCSAHLSGLAPREFAFRPGDAGRALQRTAHAPIGFPADRYKLAAFILAALRPRRRAARQLHRFRQPGLDVLDPVRRSYGDGHPRRHGHAVRPGSRHGAFLLLEELLSQFTEYWMLIMGPRCC